MRSLCRHCSLAVNKIGHQGATAICEALKFNGALTTLWLIDNMIGVQGASAIGEAPKVNGALANLT